MLIYCGKTLGGGMLSLPPLPTGHAVAPAGAPAPVEYGAAVERFLARSSLGAASRRVYRISLTGWAWPLAGREVPLGRRRRGAAPPMVPLAALDDPGADARLAAALAGRAAVADPRTVNRELSALRSATAWWRDQGWIETDPAAGLRHAGELTAPAPPLTREQIAALLRATTGLREHTLWQLLFESAAPAEDVLGLNIGHLDLAGHRARRRHGSPAGQVHWRAGTSELLRWLLAGRVDGPVFLTGRRAPAGTPAADVCPLTGRARLSYRRAAEIFSAATRPLDPAGRGWTLHQLRLLHRPAR
jgi:integrase/recombinase XerD